MTHAEATDKLSPRSMQKQSQIISAATELFLQRGFLDVSMDEIAQTAQVSKRTLYNYFPSKEELFLALAERQIDLMSKAMNFGSVNDRSAEHHLRHIAEQFISALFDPVTIKMVRLMMGEAERFPALAKSIYEKAFTDVIGKLSAVMKRHAQIGNLEITDWKLAAEHFIELATGLLHMRVVLGIEPPPKARKRKNHVERMLAMFMAAYGSRPKQ